MKPDNDDLLDKLVPPLIRDLKPYHVPASRGMVKLDAMENPYQLPPALREAWLAALGSASINRYPDPGADELRQRIRRVFTVPDDSDIVLGNGSDELIQMLALLVGGPGRTFMAPAPSFSMYEMISLFTGTGFRMVPLKEDFSMDGEAMLDAIRESQPSCIFLAYPNNPTGNSFDDGIIGQIITEAPGLVVVDEAYFSFSGRTFLGRLPEARNLMVMRTLSKSGLAGLRLGMLMGDPAWIAQLDKVRLPYNINCLTQAGASFCLDHYDVLETQGATIRADREALFRQLDGISGVRAYPSDANFILVRLAVDATRVFEELKQRGVLVKNLHQPGGVLENCLRITVGAADENSALVSALMDMLGARAA